MNGFPTTNGKPAGSRAILRRTRRMQVAFGRVRRKIPKQKPQMRSALSNVLTLPNE